MNANFGSKVQMENYENSVSCKPSVNMTHYVECARKDTPIDVPYIRGGAVPAGADPRLYDIGRFQIAASGQQTSGGQLGELWVSYEIELLKPRILPGTGGSFQDSGVWDHIAIYNSAKLTPGVAPATPFGTSTTVPLYPTSLSTLGGVACGGIVTAASFTPQPEPTGSNFNGGIPVLNSSGQPTGQLGPSAANTYYFPPGITSGKYLVQVCCTFSAAGANSAITIQRTNCIAYNLFGQPVGGPGPFADFTNLLGTGQGTYVAAMVVQITAGNAALAFTWTGTANTPTQSDLFVIYLGQTIN